MCIVIVIWCVLGFIAFLYGLEKELKAKRGVGLYSEAFILMIIYIILGGITFTAACADILKK